MARIAGVDLPMNKRLFIGLTYIYGVGRARALNVLDQAEIDPQVKVKDLTDDETRRLQKVLAEQFEVEGELRKRVQMDVKRLVEIGSYRGYRHRRNLPCRGQRTHTNARSHKGRRSGIGIRKKGS